MASIKWAMINRHSNATSMIDQSPYNSHAHINMTSSRKVNVRIHKDTLYNVNTKALAVAYDTTSANTNDDITNTDTTTKPQYNRQ